MHDWEILFTLQRNRRERANAVLLRTSFAGSMRKWSVPGMNGVETAQECDFSLGAVGTATADRSEVMP